MVRIEAEGISKRYQLGNHISVRSFLHSLWGKLFKKANEVSVSPDKTNEFWALKDVSFDLSEGEILGIIGTNGSGKSTLLKILSRVTSPTEGSATINGRVASLLEVGTGFNPELTGRENIYLNGSLLGLSKEDIKSKFDQIVEFAGVKKFIDTPIKRYSSGMTVRLGFSVAAHLDADILIIDEVLAVGDADFQKKSLARLKEIRNQKKSILFVSHSMELVASLCQRVVWIHLGKVMQIGKPAEVIQSYLKHHEQQRGKIERNQSSIGVQDSPFVSAVKMLNKHNEVIESVIVGQSVQFVATVKNLPPTEAPTSMQLWIENQNGLNLCELRSEWVNPDMRTKDQCEIKFDIPKVQLVPGLYTVNLQLVVNFQRSDFALQVFNFFVIADDYYKSGSIPKSSGQVLMDFSVSAQFLKEGDK